MDMGWSVGVGEAWIVGTGAGEGEAVPGMRVGTGVEVGMGGDGVANGAHPISAMQKKMIQCLFFITDKV
jgi:hypothetical protein